MAQVKKLKNAGVVTRNQAADVDTQFATFVAGLDDTQKLEVNNLLTTMHNLQKAKGVSARDGMQGDADMKNLIMQHYKAGTTPYVGSANGPIFTPSENLGLAGQAYNDFMNNPRRRVATTGTTSLSGDILGNDQSNLFSFKWNKFYNPGFIGAKLNLNNRAKGYIQGLLSAVEDATNKYSLGMRAIGMDSSIFENNPDINILKLALNFDWMAATPQEQEDALLQIAQISLKYGVDEESFKQVFKEYFREPTESEKKRLSWLDDGYTDYAFLNNNKDNFLNNYITDKGYHVMLKGNSFYLMDDNWNTVGDVKHIFDSYDDNGQKAMNWGYGIFSDANGKLWYGDTQDQNTFNASDPFYEIYQKFLPEYKRGISLKHSLEVTPFTTFEGEGREAMTKLIDGDVYNSQGLKIPGFSVKGKRVSDLSDYFEGNDIILAVGKDGREIRDDVFGNLGVDQLNDAKFYMLENGQLKEMSFQDVKAKKRFNYKGNHETDNWATNVLSGTASADSITSFSNLQSGDFSPFSGMKWWRDDQLDEDVPLVKNALLAVFNNPNGISAQVTRDMLMGNNPKLGTDRSTNYWNTLNGLRRQLQNESGIAILTKLVLGDPVGFTKWVLELYNDKIQSNSLTPQEERMLRGLLAYARRNTSTSAAKTGDPGEMAVNRKGGKIKKAATGTVLDVGTGEPVSKVPYRSSREIFQNDANKRADIIRDNAEANGQTQLEYIKNKEHIFDSGKWTIADTLRCSSMLVDLATMGVSIAGAAAATTTAGASLAAAPVLGMGSMALDLGADFLDDSVSTGQAIKNAGINTGMALMSVIPGGNAPKFIKWGIKYGPKLLLAASAIGLAVDDSVHSTFKKLSEGKGDKLTREDLKNLSYVLKAVVGGTLMGSSMIANRKVAAARTKELNLAVKDMGASVNEGVITSKDNKIKLTKELADEVRRLLAAGDKDGARNYIKENVISENAGITDNEIDNMFITKKGKKKFLLFGDRAEDTYSLGGTENPNGGYSEEVMNLARQRVWYQEKQKMDDLANASGLKGLYHRGVNRLANLGQGAYSQQLLLMMAEYGTPTSAAGQVSTKRERGFKLLGDHKRWSNKAATSIYDPNYTHSKIQNVINSNADRTTGEYLNNQYQQVLDSGEYRRTSTESMDSYRNRINQIIDAEYNKPSDLRNRKIIDAAETELNWNEGVQHGKDVSLPKGNRMKLMPDIDENIKFRENKIQSWEQEIAAGGLTPEKQVEIQGKIDAYKTAVTRLQNHKSEISKIVKNSRGDLKKLEKGLTDYASKHGVDADLKDPKGVTGVAARRILNNKKALADRRAARKAEKLRAAEEAANTARAAAEAAANKAAEDVKNKANTEIKLRLRRLNFRDVDSINNRRVENLSAVENEIKEVEAILGDRNRSWEPGERKIWGDYKVKLINKAKAIKNNKLSEDEVRAVLDKIAKSRKSKKTPDFDALRTFGTLSEAEKAVLTRQSGKGNRQGKSAEDTFYRLFTSKEVRNLEGKPITLTRNDVDTAIKTVLDNKGKKHSSKYYTAIKKGADPLALAAAGIWRDGGKLLSLQEKLKQ